MIDKAEARRMRGEGMTLDAIGRELGCTRERIRQIVGPLPRATRMCKRCGDTFVGTQRQRYCSRRCRGRAEAAQRARPCSECGAQCGGILCYRCKRSQWTAKREERWATLADLWAQGLPMAQIAERLDTTVNALGGELCRARAAGIDLPLRRAKTPKAGSLTKDEARGQFITALRAGHIRRSTRCERCGSMGHIEGHHEDYDRPLYVEWLCRTCHAQHHAAERAAA